MSGYVAEPVPEVRAIVEKPSIAKRIQTQRYRPDRGFSVGELEAAGLTVRDARLLGLRVDPRRRSVREENVRALRELLDKLAD